MLYVAYGSNMNIDQMKYRCPHSKIVGTGKVLGWKLVFNVHADIVECDDANAAVPVVVWDIASDDWDCLDMYEGYPSYYIKRNVDVEFDSGDRDVAVVYIMADRHKGICPPSNNYFDSIVHGYMDNGIDTEYLYNALNNYYN